MENECEMCPEFKYQNSDKEKADNWVHLWPRFCPNMRAKKSERQSVCKTVIEQLGHGLQAGQVGREGRRGEARTHQFYNEIQNLNDTREIYFIFMSNSPPSCPHKLYNFIFP